jgi:hypothetical protein
VLVTIEPGVRPPVEPHPPAEPAGMEAMHIRTGRQVEDAELRKHVLEQLAERVRGADADPTEFLGVHGPVTVHGKGFGGRNSFRAIAERLEKVSTLRVQRRKKPLVLRWDPDEVQSGFIFRHEDLKAGYDKLKAIRTGTRLPAEFERLNLSPKRIRQIRGELDEMVGRKVGALLPDIVEIWFGRWPKVQIADITLAGNDPYHLFKTRVYKRIMESMLPGFKVLALDITPMSNGSYRFFPID